MQNMKEEIMEMIRGSFDDADIPLDKIPGVDLYMDQIITIFEDFLKKNKRHPNDKLLTKTMINNYSKEGVIKPVKGKKYSKEHIIQMLIVYSLKNTITIQEIKKVLFNVYEQDHFSAGDLEVCYQKYLDGKQIERDTIPEVVQNMFQHFSLEFNSRSDLLVLLLSMSAMSVYMKKMAEKIVDLYFSENKGREKD